ncbi:MAG: hypothetical protein EKK35_23570 [Bradyrhizobiaceae bacterium]|nr:MAG: hypothetical protein EKK35_23570 [Bradyrhizobiaceae bacterium]
MFTRLAKSGLVKFRLVQPQRIAPGLHEAGLSDHTYSNNNLPGFRRPAVAGRRRSPTPALVCHWLDRGGRLECCWHPETDGAPTGSSDERVHSTANGASGRAPIQLRGLALVG